MKKLIILIFCFTFVFSFSQEKANAIWKFGLQSGVNLAYYQFGLGDASFGINFGGFASYDLSKNFSFQPELMYSIKSNIVSGNYNIIDYDNKVIYSKSIRLKDTRSMLDIAGLLRYNLFQKFYLQAGPQVSFLVQGTSNDRRNSIAVSPTLTFNNAILFADVGAGYQFNDKIGITLRHEIGITKALTDKDGNGTRLNAFLLMLRYNL